MDVYQRDTIIKMCGYIDCDNKIAKHVKCDIKLVTQIRAMERPGSKRRRRGRPPSTDYTIATKSNISTHSITAIDAMMKNEYQDGCDKLLKAHLTAGMHWLDRKGFNSICKEKGWV
jgi:hypothetical protein